MKMSVIGIVVLVIQLIGCTGCNKGEGETKPAPEFKSSIPENNAINVKPSIYIEVVFDEVITLTPNHGITINGAPVEVVASFTKLVFNTDLQAETNYKIIIPKGAIINTFKIPLAYEIQFSFTTEKAIDLNSPAMQFVANMGVGWNLGNTLDAIGEDETVWGNPRATKELIDAIRAKGFKTLRVPITWQYHIGDAPNYTIEKEWLDRVEEVVNYGLDNEMIVIINIHHDEEWVIPTYAQADKAKDQVGKVWTQIAERFKNYDADLIFETLNETRLKDSAEEWTGGTAEGRDCINQFHQVSVEAIRASGGNNDQRYIMISTYAASSAQIAIDGLVLPTSNNLIVSIHNYYPYELCLGKNGKDWGTDIDKQALDKEFDRLYNKFIANGIPVVMGEWGNLNHNNTEDRIRHASYYAKGCLDRGICPVWWDNGSSDQFGLINRQNYQWVYPGIADAIVNSGKN